MACVEKPQAMTHQHAGMLTRKSTQKESDTDSSFAAIRLLFDKAERGGKDVLQLTHLITSLAAAGSDPSAGADPYGRYQPVSALLIRQAMDPYVPMWMKVSLPTPCMCARKFVHNGSFIATLLACSCQVQHMLYSTACVPWFYCIAHVFSSVLFQTHPVQKEAVFYPYEG